MADETAPPSPGPGYAWDARNKQWVYSGVDVSGASADSGGGGAGTSGGASSDTGGGGAATYAAPAPATTTEVDPAAKPSDSADIPTVDQIGAPVTAAAAERDQQTSDLVNRFSATTLDTGQADATRTQQNQALGMQKDIYDKLMSYDPQAEAAAQAKRSTAQSLAVAKSGPGGAASHQAAQFQALQQMPAAQAEAANAANAQSARNTQLAAEAASGYATTAGATRSQDIQQASTEANLGLQVGNSIATAVGRDIQLTSDEAEFMGNASLALSKLDLDWAHLDEQQRASAVDEELRKQGLEQQWKQFKESQKVGALDILGAITGTAKSAVGTYAAGKTAGLF